MKKINKNLLIAIISILVFVLFIITFFALGSMIQNGVIENIEFSQAVQGILAFLMFSPLLVSLFFFGCFLESKRLHPIDKILKFMSVGLFVFSIFQALLSLLGFYG